MGLRSTRLAISVYDMPTDTTTAEWGQRYRQARIDRGYTQEQLAEQAGVRQAVISRVELGAGISMRNHVKLARALGVSLDALLLEVA